MPIQHVTQAASSWPDALVGDRATGARLTETIERIRWRLWHGQVRRGLDLIVETMESVDATAETASPAASAALKVARLLDDIETYVCGHTTLTYTESGKLLLVALIDVVLPSIHNVYEGGGAGRSGKS